MKWLKANDSLIQWLSGIGIPAAILLSSWIVTSSVERSKVNSEYVALALEILARKEDVSEPREQKDRDVALRKWAVRLLDQRAPERFTDEEQQALIIRGLTSEEKTEREKLLGTGVVALIGELFKAQIEKTEEGIAASSISANERNAENDQATPRTDENALRSKTAMDPLTGKWIGGDKIGKDYELTFLGMNTLTMSDGSESFSGTYHADYSQSPPKLTIDLGDHGVINTIFEFVSNKDLRFEDNEPGEPLPTAFTENALVFTRRQ